LVGQHAKRIDVAGLGRYVVLKEALGRGVACQLNLVVRKPGSFADAMRLRPADEFDPASATQKHMGRIEAKVNSAALMSGADAFCDLSHDPHQSIQWKLLGTGKKTIQCAALDPWLDQEERSSVEFRVKQPDHSIVADGFSCKSFPTKTINRPLFALCIEVRIDRLDQVIVPRQFRDCLGA